MNKIQPIALPGIHEKFIAYFNRHIGNRRIVLDAGAGHGAMSRFLYQNNFQVTAIDFNPSIYQCREVAFVKADLTKTLPFADETFEAVVAVEVWEHIGCHDTFLGEIYRILKPDGLLMISTPNILSLKSRFRFLFQGFFYSFKPLEVSRNDGLQHISAQTFDQINWLARQKGFAPVDFDIDKHQNTSRVLMLFYPFIWLINKFWHQHVIHNQRKLLVGRVLFFTFRKIT